LILLDTHALLWLDSGDRRLGSKARRATERALAAGDLAVSAITFWEVAMLILRRRISLAAPPTAWRSELLASGLVEIGVSGEIGIMAASLDDLPGDPADRLIAATAALNQATLLTADRDLLGWSGHLARQDASL
jgi:PIN domain nuclease of toxin-antitoxin system